MPTNPNKLSQFWQELKRRKVVRVITVYAAAAFVILELLSIIIEPLKLPEWTLQFAIVFLCIGFIIAVILSWIYDVHSEGGIVKTEPAEKVGEASAPPSSKSWKIASYISFVVIVALIVLNIIPRVNRDYEFRNLEKSIAVLPLDYLSEDPNKEYLANGVLDAITGHLSLIEGLRVMPRTSVEQYRENRKSAKEIGEELDVSYLIEGSFLMIGDQVKLTIQLVVAKEGDHVFFKEYDRDYKDIIVVQSEVAQTIAKEIEVAITPEEKQLIEKIPTTSLTAYDFYQQAEEQLWHYRSDRDDTTRLKNVENLYHKALVVDPSFAQAYIGLGKVYWEKNFWKEYFSINFLDSVKILVEIALELDDQLADAYLLRGNYYFTNADTTKAFLEYDKALQLNSNSWEAYRKIGQLYLIENHIESIKNLLKAYSLYRGKELPQLLNDISTSYAFAGFYEHSLSYAKQALELDGDSISYYNLLNSSENWRGHFRQSILYCLKALRLDSTDSDNLSRLAYNYMFVGEFGEALKYYRKYEERLESLNDTDINNLHRIGYVYLKNELKKEAEYYFDLQEDYCIRSIKLGRPSALSRLVYYDLAGVYAIREEKEKALENLRIFNLRTKEGDWMVTLIKNDPLFNRIRDEPEFQQIVRDVEAKYQAEHERVRKWLEENDML